MQAIYNYIPVINYVYRVYDVAAVLYLQFVIQVMLFHTWNMFSIFTLVLSKVRVQCQVRLFFCSSLISCFPSMLLRYCLNDFDMVPIAPIITGVLLLLLLLLLLIFSLALWPDSGSWPSLRVFAITVTGNTTFGRAPLDTWSSQRRALFLTTHNNHKRQTSMPRRDSNPQS